MELHRVKYPIGIQNFEKLRKEGFLYIDKTALIYELAHAGTYYFLGRPRRFGKSLLMSTLEAYFEGKRELFQGLAIGQLETEWKQYPVLHLDLNAERYDTADRLVLILDRHLRLWEDQYGKDAREISISDRFMGIIRRAYEQTGREVVILVDEYDKPLALNLENEALQDDYRSQLKAFYGVMKSADRYIRFALLTGVTKFSKVSVFSDLNNIDDISMWAKYATVCGITEQEIRANLDAEVGELAAANGQTKDECYAELCRRYDGYHFHQDTVGMYNPFSLLNTLNKREFKDYWYETGTPTMLIRLLQNNHFDLADVAHGEVSAQLMSRVDSVKDNPLPMLFQSGYLTIRGYDKEFDEYILGFPNEEVERGFMNGLLPIYTNARPGMSQFSIVQFVKEVRRGQAEAFMKRLQAMMADTGYSIVGDSELYFHNFLFIFFRLLGFYVDVERQTSEGRMDMVVKTDGYIYLMEFKLDQSADAALRQIEERHYADAFAADPRRLFRIGANFSLERRCMDDWKVVG